MRRALLPPSLLLFALLASPALLRGGSDKDLTVGWISRTPVLEFVQDSPHPDRDGWPADGSTVTWIAHVKNWRTSPRSVSYRWLQDGAPIAGATGTIALPAGGYATAELPWTWRFDRHVIAFEADTGNSLSIFTDAISVGFYVEQTQYDFFRKNQPLLGVGSNSWEEWAQRQISHFNEEFALAIYPETPAGVLDRLRIDEIVLVPDGALPITPLPDYGQMDGQPNEYTHPNKSDRTVDLQWGFPAKETPFYTDLTTVDNGNDFYLKGTLLHELGHARYLVDVYGWNVWSSAADGSGIAITEGGERVLGTPLMPLDGIDVHFTPEQGLMNQDYSFIDRYSAIVLNQIAGHRAIEGNSNDPPNEGSWLNDLPAQNRVTFRSASGNVPIPNANVRIYQATGVPGHFLTKYYDDVPDLELTTDGKGQALVGRCPFSADGVIIDHFGGSNVVAIVRVESNGKVQYGYLESRLFNLAAWRGDTDFADHDLVVGDAPCFLERPALHGPRLDSAVPTRSAKLAWSGGSSVDRYRVWVSYDHGAPEVAAEVPGRPVPAGGFFSATIRAQGRVAWWVEILHNNGCPPSRSATGLFDAPPSPRSAAAVAPVPPAPVAPLSSVAKSAPKS